MTSTRSATRRSLITALLAALAAAVLAPAAAATQAHAAAPTTSWQDLVGSGSSDLLTRPRVLRERTAAARAEMAAAQAEAQAQADADAAAEAQARADAEARGAQAATEAAEDALVTADAEAIEQAIDGDDAEAPAPQQDAALPQPFATVGAVELRLPGVVRGLGFHESANRRTLPMAPIGRGDVHTTREFAISDQAGDARWMVMPSRRRMQGPTTAADIAMPRDQPVVAPVTGTVIGVSNYALYGRVPDQLIEIVADADPNLVIRVLHVHGMSVEPGQRIEAGVTPLAAGARVLPFRSQIDRFLGAHPHVHIEVAHR